MNMSLLVSLRRNPLESQLGDVIYVIHNHHLRIPRLGLIRSSRTHLSEAVVLRLRPA